MTRAILTRITHFLVPPFQRRILPIDQVVIVVPLSTRIDFTDDETISLNHLFQHLSNYKIIFLAPDGVQLSLPGCEIRHFSRRYFGSAAAHGKLLHNPSFYKRFLDYNYIFFYHLDSLAFSDQLSEWCKRDFDYIGSPWIPCEDSPWVDRPRVGNGGFALLKVESAIKVLCNRHRSQPSTYWLDLFTRVASPWQVRTLEWLRSLFPRFSLINLLLQEWHAMLNPEPSNRNNDIFWSDHAIRYLPDFKVATVEDGLKFAFEVSPRTCLELTGGEMPFGCHAWARYDRAFWEPHLIRRPQVTHQGTTRSFA